MNNECFQKYTTQLSKDLHTVLKSKSLGVMEPSRFEVGSHTQSGKRVASISYVVGKGVNEAYHSNRGVKVEMVSENLGVTLRRNVMDSEASHPILIVDPLKTGEIVTTIYDFLVGGKLPDILKS